MKDAVVPRQAMVPMRDGVRLATDLYHPPEGAGPWPTILVRTPYGKHIFEDVTTPDASFFARHGFLVAVQDKRGKHGSEGAYRYCGHDGPDGWDTVEWLVRQPICNGRIGTYGSSYLGDTQLALARLRHPAHRCMAPHAASMLGSLGGRYTMGDTRNGGALYLATYVRWFYERGARKHVRALPPLDLEAACAMLPLADLFDRIGGPPCDWRDVVTRPPDDCWWNEAALLTDHDWFDIPALHVNSWFDVGIEDTLRLFEHLCRTSPPGSADAQYLIVSPSAHCGSELLGAEDRIGDLTVRDAGLPWQRLYLEWFGHWLRDAPPLDWPRVRYYEINRDAWRESAIWPPASTRRLAIPLASDGGANSAAGDGRLGAAGVAANDRFLSDPTDPVPTVGGARPSAYLQITPLDQSAVARRSDVLAYTSAVLGGDGLTIAGPVIARLWVSASTADVDLVVRLVDVDPEGTAVDLRDGILRCRYRRSPVAPELMVPGEVYEVEVSLQSLAVWFPPDHRVRLEIAGSSFPRYDRNLQTGGDNVTEAEGKVAEIDIWHDPAKPSRLELSVTGGLPPGLGAMEDL